MSDATIEPGTLHVDEGVPNDIDPNAFKGEAKVGTSVEPVQTEAEKSEIRRCFGLVGADLTKGWFHFSVDVVGLIDYIVEKTPNKIDDVAWNTVRSFLLGLTFSRFGFLRVQKGLIRLNLNVAASIFDRENKAENKQADS